MVVAFSEDEVVHLQELLERGKKNGVKRLRIVSKDELFEMEPYIHPDAIAALYSPDAGNLIPYEYAIALAENAVDNGVELRVRREVRAIDKLDDNSFVVHADYWEPKRYVENVLSKDPDEARGPSNVLLVVAVALAAAGCGIRCYLNPSVLQPFDLRTLSIGVFIASVFCVAAHLYLSANSDGRSRKYTKVEATLTPPSVGSGGRAVSVDEMRVGGSGSCSVNDGEVIAKESYRTKFIVNCAGSAADRISGLIGDNSFQIKPRLGDYIILNREQGKFARHTIFPCPDPVLGKGVLVQTTLWGMLILGPTARDTYLPEVMAQSHEDIQKYILRECRKLVPSFDPKETITSFCGARAKSTRGDWIIEASTEGPHFIHAAGIDSPGKFHRNFFESSQPYCIAPLFFSLLQVLLAALL